MGKFAKGYTAGFGAIVTAAIQYSDAYCHTWWPAILTALTAVGVVMVPNAKKSDQQ